MNDSPKGWKRFTALKLDRKQLARRMRRVELSSQKHAHRYIIKRFNNVKFVSREIITWLVLLAVLIGGVGVQTLWGQDTYMLTSSKRGGLYVEGVLGEISTLNPLFSSTDAEASISRLVFSSLFNYDRTGNLHKDLASGIQIDATQKIYTVTLRNDVKWHDGQTLTAYDVVYTINLIKNPTTRTKSPSRSSWIDISAKALNSRVVEFTLPAVYAAFPQALTFYILPEHTLKNTAPSALRESVFSQNPIGSGPFKFNRLQKLDTNNKSKVAHLSSNNMYYHGAPKLSRFELRAYPDETTLINAVNRGELSGATDISVVGVKNITSNRVNVTPELIDSGIFLLLNNHNPILQDVQVRRALQLAIDTNYIRKRLGGGVRPLNGPLLDGQLTGESIPVQSGTDIFKANKILDDSGWVLSNGLRTKDGAKLSFTITTTKNSEFESILPYIKSDWNKIGVDVKINVADTISSTSTFVQDTLQARNFDVLLYELVIGSDPDVYAYWHSSQIGMYGYNFANYSNKVVDANLSSARTRLEPELRNAKYKVFVSEWLNDVPAIALYQPVIEYVTVNGINAVQPDGRFVTEADRYADILYWTVERGQYFKTP